MSSSAPRFVPDRVLSRERNGEPPPPAELTGSRSWLRTSGEEARSLVEGEMASSETGESSGSCSEALPHCDCLISCCTTLWRPMSARYDSAVWPCGAARPPLQQQRRTQRPIKQHSTSAVVLSAAMNQCSCSWKQCSSSCLLVDVHGGGGGELPSAASTARTSTGGMLVGERASAAVVYASHAHIKCRRLVARPSTTAQPRPPSRGELCFTGNTGESW
jgi:hypothetical protein